LFLLLIALTLLGQQPPPQWQIAAGGKASFEVAAIKPDNGPFQRPAFPMDNGDAFTQTGGRFFADFPLLTYIQFAYKIRFTPQQRESVLAHLPDWIASERFNIQARADGRPTKDQMRLMMQSLLADRFQLKIHFETRPTNVLALTLVKPGKTGPKLRPHAEGPPCDAPAGDVFPARCDVEARISRPDHSFLGGSRNITLDLLATALSSLERLDRPVINQTGLAGTFDYTLEWTPEPTGAAPNQAALPDPRGPTFQQALRDQLGLKLESTKAPLETLVIDHVERPSEN
jgi:uncharacterized protein (TIGR03435 family)